ncbi:MAG: hypothetical protein ABGX07_10205, partial [Pirellulaceae bacterium]
TPGSAGSLAGMGRRTRTLTRIQRLLDFNSTVAKDHRGSSMAGLLVGLLVAVIVLFFRSRRATGDD